MVRARALFVSLALILAACASNPGNGQGVWHVVRPGENVYRIAQHYGATSKAVIRTNRIRDVREIQVGTRLWIPGGRSRPGAPAIGGVAPGVAVPRSGDKGLSSVLGGRGRRAPKSCESAKSEASLRFAWPVEGRLNSGFGARRGRGHDGIDIGAKRGTPVRAAEAGRVIYSGRLGDYGNLVIVKHGGSWATVYAHNRKNRVRKDAFVERGDVIAEVGSTGNASGPHLHFEIRRSNAAIDPHLCLP